MPLVPEVVPVPMELLAPAIGALAASLEPVPEPVLEPMLDVDPPVLEPMPEPVPEPVVEPVPELEVEPPDIEPVEVDPVELSDGARLLQPPTTKAAAVRATIRGHLVS
ncbi:MAG: hypothetical protein M3Z29_04945 [Pseudomonadota bacterium]|nr:hypothetical protein [Pseudomonadota bacterium]